MCQAKFFAKKVFCVCVCFKLTLSTSCCFWCVCKRAPTSSLKKASQTFFLAAQGRSVYFFDLWNRSNLFSNSFNIDLQINSIPISILLRSARQTVIDFVSARVCSELSTRKNQNEALTTSESTWECDDERFKKWKKSLCQSSCLCFREWSNLEISKTPQLIKL